MKQPIVCRWWFGCFVLLSWVAMAVFAWWESSEAQAADRFVQILEARQGIYPGQTRVVPDCGCTIRYVGTTVRGRRYTIIIDRLD